ncbi:MAG: M20/M25/M40 family metallo-hydrolase, partial [Stackebrandtia sp.]
HVGRLNLFCEPTGLRYLPRATASATASIRVAGHDAIDDAPHLGHNATVLLGFLAQHLGVRLGDRDGVCIAGLHTGLTHNRVYGNGELLVNLAYRNRHEGLETQEELSKAVDEGLSCFADRFTDVAALGLTARDCRTLTTVEWLKRNLPTLDNGDPWAERLLREAGVPRWPDDRPPFTCDAIWMAGVPDAFTVVFGPGDLAANNAHAAGEFADKAELDAFAAAIARILSHFTAGLRRDHP